jgi:hypothetical protein
MRLLVVGAAWLTVSVLPVASESKPPEWQLLETVADARGFRAEFDSVTSHLRTMAQGYDEALGSARLSRVLRALTEPWSLPELAAELRGGLESAMTARGGADLSGLLERSAGWLDLTFPPLPALDALWLEIQPADAAAAPLNQDLLDRLSAYVAACHAELKPLTAGWSEEEVLRLQRDFPLWCEAFYRVHFPQGEITTTQAELIEQVKTVAGKMDRARLLAVAMRVARLSNADFLTSLPKRLSRTPRTKEKLEGFSADLVASAGSSAEARVVLLGTGKTTVSGPAALIIDLGGDDEWQRAAVVDDAQMLVSVVLELNGNDRYAATTPGPAYAAGGVALLVDVRGKDQYVSARLGQSAAALGVAALLDLAGDDQYRAEDFSQGYAFTGISYLLDRAGNDVYQAWAYAQGAGNGNGCSALADGEGDDRYVANGVWPDVYGDSGPGSFHGASQGYSFGFRDGVLLPGGLATLADFGDGADYYESGNFSQGGAYFWGFGLMFDGGGDDENHGFRYSQGFGVHQAAGMRWDAGGNDSYFTQCAANCGAAWDEGVGWLLDESGDDRYEVGGLALGGTANTAVAILMDGGGDDHYGGGGGADSQGGCGGSDYHNLPAIGALIDLGNGKDTYTRAGRGDGMILTGDWHGIFVDVKEKSAAALLSGKELAKLLSVQPVKKP